MAKIPKVVDKKFIKRHPKLRLVNRGKVRDTYSLLDFPWLLLVIATDRVSIFDFILSFFIPGKGKNLTQMTVYWLTEVFKDVPNHLVAYGGQIDQYLPEELQDNVDLQERAIIVKKLNMLDAECIVRGHLTGSGWKDYKETGMVCGQLLPEGLNDGSLLPEAIFTPTTKSKSGHDKAMLLDKFLKKYGAEPMNMSLVLFKIASQHCASKGIVLADTKFELGYDENGMLTIGDEIITPDSSRFWWHKDWLEAQKEKKSPKGLDKQPIRDAGKILGISGSMKNTRENLEFISKVRLPQEKTLETQETYAQVVKVLTQ